MPKRWVVAKHEYAKITRKRSFLLGTLAMPLFFEGLVSRLQRVAASQAERDRHPEIGRVAGAVPRP